MQEDQMGRKYLRPQTAAERYDVTVSTVWRWANEARFAYLGFPKFRKIGPNTSVALVAEFDDFDERRIAADKTAKVKA